MSPPTGSGGPCFEPKQPSQVDDGNNRSAQVAHAINVLRDLWSLRDLFEDNDFLNLADRKHVLLAGQAKTDELR